MIKTVFGICLLLALGACATTSTSSSGGCTHASQSKACEIEMYGKVGG